MNTNCLLMGILLFSFSAGAAIPQKNSSVKPRTPAQKVQTQDSNQRLNEIQMALRLPMENRILALSRNPNSFNDLKQLSFDKKQSLQTRWKALTALARLDFQRARPQIVEALNSKQWFLRNAALVTLVPGDKMMALDWSIKLLKDPALVVRTAAVENLRKLRNRDSREALIKAFRASENFKGKQSLWIRHYIARALAEMAVHGEEGVLVGMLHEDDKRIHPWAIRGLERLTGKRMNATRSVPENRNLWLAWWKNPSQL